VNIKYYKIAMLSKLVILKLIMKVYDAISIC